MTEEEEDAFWAAEFAQEKQDAKETEIGKLYWSVGPLAVWDETWYPGKKNLPYEIYLQEKTSFTYIIHDVRNDLLKIGHSKTPIVRWFYLLKEIGYFKPIYCEQGNQEKELFAMFKEIRTKHPIKHGGYTEWFLNDGQILDYLDTLKPSN